MRGGIIPFYKYNMLVNTKEEEELFNLKSNTETKIKKIYSLVRRVLTIRGLRFWNNLSRFRDKICNGLMY